MRFLAIVLLIPLLAGCFTDSESRNETDEPSPSTTITSSPPVPEPEMIPLEPSLNTTAPKQLSLDQCTGWDVGNFLPAPLVPDDNTPPGWERSPTSTGLTGIAVRVFQCGKIGVGPIERGPITLMLDVHSNVDVPDRCKEDAEDGSGSGTVLAKLYVSDPEVGEYLRTTYGMPTGNLTITNSTEGVGPAYLRTVRWNADGGEESEVMMLDDSSSVVRPALLRYYWARGNQLMRWQMDLEMDGPDFSNRQGWGTINEPMLAARVSQEFAGLADWFDSIVGSHTFLAYNDFGCEEPIEPI